MGCVAWLLAENTIFSKDAFTGGERHEEAASQRLYGSMSTLTGQARLLVPESNIVTCNLYQDASAGTGSIQLAPVVSVGKSAYVGLLCVMNLCGSVACGLWAGKTLIHRARHCPMRPS